MRVNNMMEPNQKKISDAIIRRLPRYYKQLCDLEAAGVDHISSQSLGERLEVKASQIRQDLNSFGGFGQQGYGYPVSELKTRIAKILHINKQWKMIIVGAGNIGRALSSYGEFGKEGFEILALFDANPSLIGKKSGNLEILDVKNLTEFIEDHKVDIMALTVPQKAVKELMMIAEKSNVGAVWNFSPADIFSPKVVVENIHLTDSLMALSYHLGNIGKK